MVKEEGRETGRKERHGFQDAAWGLGPTEDPGLTWLAGPGCRLSSSLLVRRGWASWGGVEAAPSETMCVSHVPLGWRVCVGGGCMGVPHSDWQAVQRKSPLSPPGEVPRKDSYSSVHCLPPSCGRSGLVCTVGDRHWDTEIGQSQGGGNRISLPPGGNHGMHLSSTTWDWDLPIQNRAPSCFVVFTAIYCWEQLH